MIVTFEYFNFFPVNTRTHKKHRKIVYCSDNIAVQYYITQLVCEVADFGTGLLSERNESPKQNSFCKQNGSQIRVRIRCFARAKHI